MESYFLKPTKCLFEQERLEYLGIVVDGDKTTIDPAKIDGIKDWPWELKNLKEVRSTLGVLGYQRPFVRGYANLVKPITNLLKKSMPFAWTEDC